MTLVIESQKALVSRFYEEFWNERNFEAIGEIMTEDVVFRGSLGMDMEGHAGVIRYAEMVFDAFPDFHNALEEMIAEDGKLAACLTYSGTHEGEIFGIPGTGNPIRYVGTAIFIFTGELISHCWVLGDRLELLRQIGRDDDQTEDDI